MTRTVQCIKLNREAEGLKFAPWPGELGQRIFENVSQEAWREWMKLQTMLINEKQLSLINPEHKNYLATQMERYFFGGEVDQPEGFVSPQDDG